MKSWGLGLVALGVGVFVLPLLKIQFRGLNRLDPDMQNVLGIIAISLGVILYVIGILRARAADRKKH